METRLSLVNHLLQVVGERRVVTLETGHPSVIQAVQALEGYNRDFQGMGWWFNKNREQPLVQDNNGEIQIPGTALEFQISDSVLRNASPLEKMRYVRRGNRVYDSIANTYTIGRPIYADLTILLEVEDLPQVAASYLKHWSAKNYYEDDDGDNVKATRLGERVDLAWAALQSAQIKYLGVNALDGQHAQNLRYRIGSTGSPSNPMFPGGRIR